MDVKWERSEGGNVSSKCGRFSIEPLFMGCTTAQAYRLFVDGRAIGGIHETQRDAKREAVGR